MKLLQRNRPMLATAVAAACLLTAGIAFARGPSGMKVCHVLHSEPAFFGLEFRVGKVLPAKSEAALQAHLRHGDETGHIISRLDVGEECTFLAPIE